MIRRLAILLLMTGLVLSTSAQAAEIYRCMHGDTMIFADRPCGEDAEVHQTESTISVIAASDSLDQIMQQNQRYLEQRAQHQAARRAARLEQQRNQPAAVRQQAIVEYVPVYYPVRQNPSFNPPATAPRVDRRRNAERSARSASRARILSLSNRPDPRGGQNEP